MAPFARSGRTLFHCSAAALFLAAAACGGGGGGSSTPAPSTPTAPSAPAPAPANTWSVAGQVVATGSQEAIGGATLTPGWSLSAVTADGQGNYQLGDAANPPSTPYPVSISGTGLVAHDVWITWQRGARSGVTLDAIRDRAPFSLDFYRKLVRGTYDQEGAPWPVLRWTAEPKFYVKTADQNGRAIEPEVLASVLGTIRRAVPAWTGGRMNAAAVESGTETRAAADGWINVEIRRDPNERRLCGTAWVGANPGTIILNDDVCSCGSNKIPGAVTLHEVGHALGFFHVDDKRSVMYPFIAGDCPAGELSPAESYHAAIAYARPRGNTDPDHDPSSGATLRMTPNPIIRVH